MTGQRSTAMVYLVDDEFSIRDSLSILIESTGQRVRSFETAEAFLESYESDVPGCLILDIRMPSMSGLELQEALVKRNIDIPIIFISGNAEVADTVKAFRAGAVDFLEKPFQYSVLLDRIDEALQKDRQNRANILEKRQLQERISRLTSREKEVLSLIISNHSNKQSAKILEISNRTIDVHRSNIMQKMQVDSIAELIVMVMKSNILNVNEGKSAAELDSSLSSRSF